MAAKYQEPLTATYIDSQTLGCVVIALEAGKPINWTEWVTYSFLMSTCVLMSVDEVRISPPSHRTQHSVRAYTGTPGNHGILSEGLLSSVKGYSPDPRVIKDASQTIATWAARNPEILAQKYSDLRAGPDYEPWIDYESSKGWPTAAIILNGLADEAFLPAISKAMGINIAEAQSILLSSRNPTTLSEWCKKSYKGEDKELAKVLFTINALLRGRYHDRVSELNGSNIIHHPIRSKILKTLKTEGGGLVKSSNTLEYIAKIVIAGSLTESSPAERIKLWANNVSVMRNAILYTKRLIIPSDDLPEEIALNHAMRAVQECKIRVQPKLFEAILHHSVALGLGAATSFLLSPWLFPITVVGSEFATNTIEHELVGGSLSRSNYRLSRLARGVPGRLLRA